MQTGTAQSWAELSNAEIAARLGAETTARELRAHPPIDVRAFRRAFRTQFWRGVGMLGIALILAIGATTAMALGWTAIFGTSGGPLSTSLAVVASIPVIAGVFNLRRSVLGASNDLHELLPSLIVGAPLLFAWLLVRGVMTAEVPVNIGPLITVAVGALLVTGWLYWIWERDERRVQEAAASRENIPST